MIMAVLNEKCERCKEAAISAFNIADMIEGIEGGGISAGRILLGTKIDKYNDKITVYVDYTYPETCGLSDVVYHYKDAGKRLTDKFTFIDRKAKLNGKSLFVDPYYEESKDLLRDFYEEFSDVVKPA